MKGKCIVCDGGPVRGVSYELNDEHEDLLAASRYE